MTTPSHHPNGHGAERGTDRRADPQPSPHPDPQRAALETIAAMATAALGAPLPQMLPGLPAGASVAARAKALYAARRRRDRAFRAYPGLLADPAWDIMLDLCTAEAEGRPVSVSSAGIAACVAATTALRWLTTLEARGLIERLPDGRDRRRYFLKLTAAGHAVLKQALAG